MERDVCDELSAAAHVDGAVDVGGCSAAFLGRANQDSEEEDTGKK